LKKRKNILVCPLDWGLGHAARCTTIIRELKSYDVNIIIAADKRPLAFLKQEFSELEFIQLKGYNISYQKKGSLKLKLFSFIPKIIWGIFMEHQNLKKIISDYQIDIVISDNRYGLWHKKTKNIFITHQILIKSPFKLKIFDYLLFRINNQLVKKFNECWIPDFKEGKNLSGDLSHKYRLSIESYFIGALSRFSIPAEKTITKYDLMVILSGPEPQRSIFEKIVLKELSTSDLKTIILRGTPESTEIEINNNTTSYPHLNTPEMQKKISESDIILCRSGYSTIMDLSVFGKKAILVPTPGQTEQEYLAKYYLEKKYYFSTTQNNFNLTYSINKSIHYNGIKINNDLKILRNRIFYLINS
jgi:uncharacterized protein (TIGR00661 family)